MALIERYFECKTEGSNKFWALSYLDEDNQSHIVQLITKYGKIGSNGALHSKLINRQYFAAELARLIKSKRDKGYKEVINNKSETKETVTTGTWMEIL